MEAAQVGVGAAYLHADPTGPPWYLELPRVVWSAEWAQRPAPRRPRWCSSPKPPRGCNSRAP
eukprot:5581467-Lingulodinium_polyedra.AAC.1